MEIEFLRNKKILIISPESWDHIPVSKHHYSLTLAALGNQIYFLNPPSNTEGLTPANVPGNLIIVNYRKVHGVNKLPEPLRNFFNKRLIRKILKICGNEFDVIWTFDAFRFQNLKLFNALVKIYHVVDVHESRFEQELAKTADVILAVSDMILNRFSNNSITRKINHGLASHFYQDHSKGIDISRKSINKLKVGYVGNLDNWCLDKVTLLTIIEKNPDIEFNFVGPYKSGSLIADSLIKLKNCTLTGKVSYLDIPLHLLACDLFLMCYDGSNKEVNSNHHKILEYLSTGKPVVMNFTDEYKDKTDLVAMSNENAELPLLLSNVVKNMALYTSVELAQKRREYALSNSYQHHVATIDQIIIQTLAHATAPH